MLQDILEDRYLQPGENTFSDVTTRVSSFLGTKDKDLMDSGTFLYNSPALMNAGTAHPMMSACFVLPITDSMDGIFDTLKRAAQVFKVGGGVGINFSPLRPKGAKVHGTGGTSSGVIEFLEVFNSMVKTVKSGGRRRGAAIAILNDDHPDIIDFIKAKSISETKLTNFNLSVLITNKFLTAVENDQPWDLKWGGRLYTSIRARLLYDLIIDGMYNKGEPGILFFDTINQYNPMKEEFGDIITANPCGEQLLCVDSKTGGGESCNLGSANLTKFIDGKKFKVADFMDVVRVGVVGLNRMLELNELPLKEIRDCTMKGRKIGFGIMGWADMLVMAGIPYNSSESIGLISVIGSAMKQEAVATSKMLAEQYGPYREGLHRRNACLLNIAPTGTLSILANCSSGIEPVYKWVYDRVVCLKTGDKVYRIIHPLYEKLLDEHYSRYKQELLEYAYTHGSIQNAPYISQEHKEIYVVASDIEPDWHIQHQATWQQYVDSSISKTCNVSADTSKEEISDLVFKAHDAGIKGLTILREWSRNDAVMKAGNETHRNGTAKRKKALSGKTLQYASGCGTLYITVNFDESGKIIEVLANPNGGGCNASIEAMCRLASVALRNNHPVTDIIRQLRKVNPCVAAGKNKQAEGKSCADIIGRCLAEHLKDQGKPEIKQSGPVCPDCGAPVAYADGCRRCTECSWSKCG